MNIRIKDKKRLKVAYKKGTARGFDNKRRHKKNGETYGWLDIFISKRQRNITKTLFIYFLICL